CQYCLRTSNKPTAERGSTWQLQPFSETQHVCSDNGEKQSTMRREHPSSRALTTRLVNESEPNKPNRIFPPNQSPFAWEPQQRPSKPSPGGDRSTILPKPEHSATASSFLIGTLLRIS